MKAPLGFILFLLLPGFALTAQSYENEFLPSELDGPVQMTAEEYYLSKATEIPGLAEARKAISFYSGPGDADEAIALLEERIDESSPAELKKLLADLYVAGGDFGKAEAVLEASLEAEITTDALFLLALIKDEKGDKDDRDALAKALLAEDPAHPGGLSLAGQKAYEEENFGLAEAYYKESFASSMELPMAFKGLSDTLAAQGDGEEALYWLYYAEKLDEGDAALFYQRAQLLYDMRRYEEAEGDLREALALEPENPFFLLDLGRTLIKENRLEEAGEVLSRGLEIRDDIVPLHFQMGKLLYYENEWEKAYEEYRKVLALNHDYSYAFPTMADLCFILKKYNEAAQYYIKSYAADRKDVTYPLLVFISLYKSGNEDKAKRFMTQEIKRLNTPEERDSALYHSYKSCLDFRNLEYFEIKLGRLREGLFKERLMFYLAALWELRTGSLASSRIFFTMLAEEKGAREFDLAHSYLDD